MKVLIITYYWPPAGGPGVQRWLKFVKYFRDFGIEPIVYCPENPTYPILDTTLEEEIPSDITILKQSIFEPYRFAEIFSKKESKTISKGIIAKQEKQSFVQRLLLYIRGNFFIPDARKFWIRPSVKYLKKYIANNDIDTIITTGPPHSVHLIGLKLKKELSINWITDFRDPWTTIGYHDKLKLNASSVAKHKQLEKAVVTTADHIVVTSYTTKKEFKELTDDPVSVITNGYDQEGGETTVLDKKFTLSHIGSLLSGRNPKMLWKVLFDLTEEFDDFSDLFRLQLVGAVSDDVLASIDKAGLSNFLDIKGYVPHQEAIAIQRSSQVLVLIEIDSKETRCIIPGKLFEYMISKRPIIALGPKGADIELLIKETACGHFFEYDDYQQIKEIIRTHFRDFKQNRLVANTKEIEKYSRRELTKVLSDVLKNINR